MVNHDLQHLAVSTIGGMTGNETSPEAAVAWATQRLKDKLTDIMLELIAKKQINVEEIYADSKKTEADTDEKSI